MSTEVHPFLLRPYLHGLDETNGEEVLLQELNSKPFHDDITKCGLEYTYRKRHDMNNVQPYTRTKHPRHVIIVGAGMAGLSSAYELSQAGHNVTILELQQRVGGRVKTIHQPFTRGLHAEGGAMRIPPSHYLTDHYMQHFNVATQRFQNENSDAFYYFYGHRIPISEWNKRPGEYLDMFWKGWDDNIGDKKSFREKGIPFYWDETVKPVIEELERKHDAEGWKTWVEKWSKFSIGDFLKTDTHQESNCSLRPWPPAAIEAFRVQEYVTNLECSLVDQLRDQIGKSYVDPLYLPINGMSELPWAFIEKSGKGWNPEVDLRKNIQYGIKIQRVKVDSKVTGKVTVSGRHEATKKFVEFTGDAVILTVPLTVLRNMDIPLSLGKQQAIANVFYMPSTKILLQCKTRFWQKKYGIQGGFSTTNLPIGQFHYPDYVGSCIPDDERGILVVYTTGQDSLVFGAQTHDEAIEDAINQISKIHPEIRDEFEVGAVQAWCCDPTEQGAFVYLKPDQYNEAITKLLTSDHPIYLAGEAISWSNGWIQGALESGLSAAYQFYRYNENIFAE